MSRWLGKGICQNHKQASNKLIKKWKPGKISQHVRIPHKVFSATKISGLKTPLLPSFTGTPTTTILRFLFRSARTSCTTSDGSRPVPQEKSGSLIYRHICLMNHVKTHQTNPMAPWHPLDALLTPWDPLATPQSTPSDP